MKRIELWAKRPVNTNFLIFMIIAVALALFAGVMYLRCVQMDETLDGFSNEIKDARSDGEIDDVEGYGIIFSSFFYGFGALGFIFTVIFKVFLPLLISIVVAVQATISRLVYSRESERRLLCYRIFTVICCVTTVAMFIFFSLIFFSETLTLIIALIADIAVITGVVLCLRNTFTDRIKG